MELLLIQMQALAKRVWKYRWMGLAIGWSVGLVGLVVAFVVPNQYQATARIYVDTQSMLKPLMSGMTVPQNVDLQVQMLSKTLISRPNVEKLIRMADLDLKKHTKAEQEELIDSLMKQLTIATTGKDNLYTLAYKDEKPETAKKVVQSLVSIFVESSLGASRKDTATATTFINEQIKSYEAKLEEAETRLKEFRLRNIDLMEGGKDSAARLAEMRAQLDQARLQLREAEQARDAARAQMTAERARANDAVNSPDSAANVPTPEIDGRLEGLRRGLDGLLQRFTDQHPDVVTTRRLIRELEEQKKREVAQLRKLALNSPAGGPNQGLVEQEMGRVLASAEVQVASLRARVSEYQARYAQSLELMKTAPQLEAEAAQLNRDYAVHKKNYDELVSRRESAAISGELDVAAGVADFRLIEPPRVTPQPVAPNRYLLLAIGLVTSLGVAVFSAFAASQLRPVFFDANELGDRTELPILGVVSRIMGDAELRKRRMDRVRVMGAAAALVLLYATAMAVYYVLQARQIA
ncbi:MAG: Wzz/FepE/Etk N-terminal domain-containing protein [Inhella sp.]|uniref:XrtA system polysaccharide chain length determinant n=2 Tax=Inhella sp. TaxID=1921806 RepID=UPI0022C71B54|nr:XrtA system polysaccharide chain length determinant [Inhella sp.]MCZ8234210.1 Wzz/FepE/Etk N-terminal domain-containing protein [Inhella sp.]